MDELEYKVSLTKGVCLKYNLYSTIITKWRKDRVKIQKKIEEEGRGGKKSQSDDGLSKLGP